jgi:hypothetical protein
MYQDDAPTMNDDLDSARSAILAGYILTREWRGQIGDRGSVRLLPGQLPDAVVFSVASVESIRLIGSVIRYESSKPDEQAISSIEVVLEGNASRTSLQSSIEDELTGQGWKRIGWARPDRLAPLVPDPAGFHMSTFTFPGIVLEKQNTNAWLTINAYSLPGDRSVVHILQFAELSPRLDDQRSADSSYLAAAMLPIIPEIPGVSIQESYDGGSTDFWYSNAYGESDRGIGLIAPVIWEHLQRAGWQILEACDEGAVIWSKWRASSDHRWEGAGWILQDPAGAGIWLHLRVYRAV